MTGTLPPTLAQNMAVTTSSDEALNLYCQGKIHLLNLDRAKAALQFDKAISLDPDFAMAYVLRAWAANSPDEYQSFMKKGLALIDKMPLSEQNFLHYAQATMEGNTARKMKYLNDLMEFYPYDPFLQILAGTHYQLDEKDDDKAIAFFTKATELEEHSTAWNLLGYTYLAMKDYQNAEKSFLNYIEAFPDNFNPYDSYAEFLMIRGDHANAIIQYRNALAKDSLYILAYKMIGDNYTFLEDYESARQSYQMLYDKSDRADEKLLALEYKACSSLHGNNLDGAINGLTEYETLARQNQLYDHAWRANFLKGYILCETGHPEQARKCYDEAERISREEPVSPILKARMQDFRLHLMNCHVYTSSHERKMPGRRSASVHS